MADRVSSDPDSRPQAAHVAVLVACSVAAVAHQATHLRWFIEDAAICFAYARNIAAGEGVVPFPGGERIEAFSDPTWVAVLTLFQALGLDGFEVSKPLAMLFTVATVPVVWRLAREALPEHRGPGALVAPILLAANAQHAIWAASGLENALWGLLLGVALLRTVREARAGGFPWGAVAWLLVVWSRPEGALYAAVAFAWYASSTLRAGRGGRPLAWWLAVVGLPSALLEALRLWYFAWPLPNTYYAKIHSRGVAWLDWQSRGWNQLREWADRLWQAWLVPAYLVGLTGTSGRRAAAGLAVVVVLGATLLWPGTDDLRALALWPDLPDPPRAWVQARIVLLLAAAVGLPFLALGGSAGVERALLGHTLATGLLFSILADGDWMGAFRWVGLVTVPGSVLLAVGLVEIADALERRATGAPRWAEVGWVAAAFAVALQLPPNFSQTRDHLYHNRDVTPQAIRLRVDHLRWIARRTFHDGPIRNLDIDQGAFLWWAPDFREVDIGKLVDVPMARHWFQQRAFVKEYVFGEVRPTFANVSLNGFWARHTGLPYYPEWDATYFQVPSYRTLWGEKFVGLYARRDLVVAPRWEGEPRRVAFAGGLALEGLATPAPWTLGRDGYLEAPLSLEVPWPKGRDARMLAFLSGEGRLAVFEVPLGYGFYPMAWWKPGEVFRGRFAVAVPELPPGRYDLGVVLLGPDRSVLPALSAPAGVVIGGRDAEARFAVGEVRFPGAVEIVAASDLAKRTAAARDEIVTHALAGACEDAEQAWIRLQRHRPNDPGWHEAERPRAARALADCHARRADDRPDEAAEWLARAHRWDHRSPELARAGGPVADRLLEEGRAARAAGDWERAYRAFSDVLGFQPWRSWARRWAEEARDHRLGLTDDVRVGIGGEDDLRAVEGRR